MSSTEITDGRRLRSQDSRQRIVRAMLDLVHEGKIAPTAEEVASKADVGLRTVFRHFKDMQNLYAEMGGEIRKMIEPIVSDEPRHPDWRANLAELVERRLRVYEVVAPYRVAAEVHKFHSSSLLHHHLDIVAAERERLLSLFPRDVVTDTTLLESLEAVLSFDMWNQLRNDQRLSPQEARLVVLRIISSLVPESVSSSENSVR